MSGMPWYYKFGFNNLDNESEKLNDNCIDIEHVVLSILSFKKLGVTLFVKDFGINYENFKNVINYMRGNSNEPENLKNIIGIEVLDYSFPKELCFITNNNNMNLSEIITNKNILLFYEKYNK
jgi:hypothetical protein